MEVVAVSWSKPRWLDINGARTWSSIIREPTSSIHITNEGIEENDLAAHDGPVYVFFQHHYDYWRTKLGLPPTAWNWCHWGENITLRTDVYLDENDINLGDIWQVGDGVQLQVCGARIPCFKLSWRCGQKDSWLMDLAKTGFCGVYMKILRAGVIRPGDRGQIMSKSTSPISVAAITRLAFEGSLKTKDTMNLLAQDPYLLSMNKLVFLRKLSMLRDQELLCKDHWKGWRAFRPSKIVDECEHVKSFYLKPVDGQALGTYLPGQFAIVRLPNGKAKTWTVSSFTNHEQPQHYRLTIKNASENGASNWMHTKCSTSTKLYLRAPAGTFHLDWSSLVPGRQVYLSAGVGITPMLAMLAGHFKHYTMAKAPAIWVHVEREATSVPWNLVKEVFDIYNGDKEPKEALQLCLFLTSPGSEQDISCMMRKQDLGDRISILEGRPTSSFLSTLLSQPYTIDPLNIKPIEIAGRLSTFYICGPPSFEDAMRTELKSLDVPEALVRSESFSHSAALSGATAVSKALVKFSLAQVTAEWIAGNNEVVAQDQSLLELAESSGLEPAYGCRAGLCGACKVKLVKGTVSGGLQGDGGVLICSAKPSSEIVELEM